MTVMADRSGRPAPVRRRMKTLTQAALNADKTVEQVEDVLDGLGKTMAELNSSLSQLNSTVERLEDGLDTETPYGDATNQMPTNTARPVATGSLPQRIAQPAQIVAWPRNIGFRENA